MGCVTPLKAIVGCKSTRVMASLPLAFFSRNPTALSSSPQQQAFVRRKGEESQHVATCARRDKSKLGTFVVDYLDRRARRSRTPRSRCRSAKRDRDCNSCSRNRCRCAPICSTLALCSDIEACFLRGAARTKLRSLTASGLTMLSNCAAWSMIDRPATLKNSAKLRGFMGGWRYEPR